MPRLKTDRWIILCTVIISLLIDNISAQAGSPVSSAQVKNAIRRGVHYLLSQWNAKTYWEHGAYDFNKNHPLEYGGETALVVESLLDAEQSLKIKRLDIFKSPMKQSIAFLNTVHTNATYATSFQANVLALLPRSRRYRATLKWDANYLYRSIHIGGGYSYVWLPQYVADDPRSRARRKDSLLAMPANLEAVCAHPEVLGNSDNSNTQYGILGMWAAAHSGLNIPARYWEHAANHWRRDQFANGTWGYPGWRKHYIRNAYMEGHAAIFTPAGVASLLICDEFLGSREVGVRPLVDRNVASGLAWINRHFAPNTSDVYEMYCYERVGLATGLQQFGGHNWYNDYCRTLVPRQNADGSWWPYFFTGTTLITNPQQQTAALKCIGTAYALLILDRGLNPTFMDKLQYTKDFYGQWNARQRDVANITSWVSSATETPMNWQVVDFHSPVSNWLHSPILTITGNEDPHFTKDQIAKLRAYINAGGMVLCSCEGNSEQFQGAMIKYGREVVNDRYEFHRLTTKSKLFTIQPWYHMYFNMLAISNGVRDLWIITPEDLSAVWERRAFAQKKDFEFPLNLYLYATGKGYLADRLHSLTPPPARMPPKRMLTVGLLQYHGNWNPEPGAWPRLAALVADKFHTGIKLLNVTPDHLNPATIPLVHMTGAGYFSLTATQIRELRTYLDRGGMLFADSAGGKRKFTDAFTQLTMTLYPASHLRSLPGKCSIYTGSMPGGTNASRVAYRRYFTDKKGVKHTPEMLGIKRGGRWVIVFSPDDVTSGLLGTNTWGISGYRSKSAIALAGNVVEYASKQRH